MKLNYFFVLLIILCSKITSLSRKHCEQDLTVATGAGTAGAAKGNILNNKEESRTTAMNLVKKCYDGFVDTFKPEMCFKKPADGNEFYATKCPKGYNRIFFQCKEKCREGYINAMGLCKAACKTSYAFKTETGICEKSANEWYYPTGYTPKVQNTSCDDGYERTSNSHKCRKSCAWEKSTSGVLTKTNRLFDCGNNSCTFSQAECNKGTVFNKPLSELQVAIDYAQKHREANTQWKLDEAVDKETREKAYAALGLTGKDVSLDVYKRHLATLTPTLRYTALDNTKKRWKAYKFKNKELVDKPAVSTITTICNTVYDYLLKFTQPELKGWPNTITGTWNYKAGEYSRAIWGTQGSQSVFDACETGVNSNACISTIIQNNVRYEPQQYMIVTGNYFNAQCDLSFPAMAAPTEEQKDLEQMSKVPNGCVRMYQHINYEGYIKDVCDNGKKGLDGFIDFKSQFNDDISSMIVGSGVDLVVLWEHGTTDNKGFGRFLELGGGAMVPDMTKFKYTSSTGSANDIFSSINFGLQKCSVIQYDDNTKGAWDKTKIYCDSKADYNLPIEGKIKHFKATTFSNDKQLLLYSETDFKGTEKRLDNYTDLTSERNNDPSKEIGFAVIRSFKLLDR